MLVYHPAMRSCRAIIHLQNLHSNLQVIRDFTGGSVKLCLAVKANGYGHGAVAIAQAAMGAGIDCLGVVAVGEALELRAAGITAQVLLLGLAAPRECFDVVKHRISAVVADEDLIGAYADAAKSAGIAASLHLEIDTGMGRIGCPPEKTLALARLIAGTPGLKLEGIYSHFPVADAVDREYTDEQIKRFARCIETVRKDGISPETVHLANSAGFRRFPESWFDMVRVGIAAYGYPGGPEEGPPLPLKPVMELRAPVSFVKRVAAGTGLSYGHTYTTKHDTVIATVLAGYADGYRRGLSNRSRVLINGRTYPVVGTVCMDQFLVDLGPHPDVKLHDEAVLFGPDKDGPDAAELAAILNTIAYEVTCGVSTRVPRVYTD